MQQTLSEAVQAKISEAAGGFFDELRSLREENAALKRAHEIDHNDMDSMYAAMIAHEKEAAELKVKNVGLRTEIAEMRAAALGVPVEDLPEHITPDEAPDLDTEQYELFLFDIDGTLADRDSHKLLPGVTEWFEHNRERKIALVTNQGGVGMRHWMEVGRFGEPEKFPNEEQARAHIGTVNHALPGGPYPFFVCFAYQSQKSGKWAPIPDGHEDDPEWQRENRKPNPGMIFRAIKELGSRREVTLFVGDREEDRAAAANAEVAYLDAAVFFNRAE